MVLNLFFIFESSLTDGWLEGKIKGGIIGKGTDGGGKIGNGNGGGKGKNVVAPISAGGVHKNCGEIKFDGGVNELGCKQIGGENNDECKLIGGSWKNPNFVLFFSITGNCRPSNKCEDNLKKYYII